MLQDGAEAIPDAVTEMPESPGSVLVDLVIVAEVVNDPQDGADAQEGHAQAKPDLNERIVSIYGQSQILGLVSQI